MHTATPDIVNAEIERLFRQAADMLQSVDADDDLATRLLNQLAVATEAALTRRRKSDQPQRAVPGRVPTERLCLGRC